MCEYGTKLIANNYDTLKRRFDRLSDCENVRIKLAQQLTDFRVHRGREFENIPFRLKEYFNGCAINFWGAQADSFPELAIVALSILNIHPSEAPVERSFSKQKLIHRPLRNRLGDENVNRELYYSFNHKTLTKIASEPTADSREIDDDEEPTNFIALMQQYSSELNHTINDLVFPDDDDGNSSDSSFEPSSPASSSPIPLCILLRSSQQNAASSAPLSISNVPISNVPDSLSMNESHNADQGSLALAGAQPLLSLPSISLSSPKASLDIAQSSLNTEGSSQSFADVSFSAKQSVPKRALPLSDQDDGPAAQRVKRNSKAPAKYEQS